MTNEFWRFIKPLWLASLMAVLVLLWNTQDRPGGGQKYSWAGQSG